MGKELALIGCGNMGSAIARGVVRAGLIAPEGIVVSDAVAAAAERLAGELGCTGTCDNAAAVKGAAMVLIAVKPQYLDDVVRGFAAAVAPGAVVVSIAAGVTIARLEGLLAEGTKVVRIMPNLAAQVGEGMASVSPNALVSADELARVVELFESFGKAEVVPERLIDAVVAVSGSAPAYVCLFIEAMADAAVAEGMPRAQAYAFAEQAVRGTATYLQETGTHPAVLKDMVCSPGGTTIEAVAALESGGFRATVMDAMRVCAQRNRDMA